MSQNLDSARDELLRASVRADSWVRATQLQFCVRCLSYIRLPQNNISLKATTRVERVTKISNLPHLALFSWGYLEIAGLQIHYKLPLRKMSQSSRVADPSSSRVNSYFYELTRPPPPPPSLMMGRALGSDSLGSSLFAMLGGLWLDSTFLGRARAPHMSSTVLISTFD